MRKTDVTQHAMFSYRSLEERIPEAHPLRRLRILVDGILQSMSAEFAPLYSRRGRPSIAPERLLRASLIQTLFTIRSERQLVQHIEYNLLYRWFVGMNIDEAVWNHSTFSANRDRLFGERMAQRFFAEVLLIAEWQDLISDEHFTVDGTQIEGKRSMNPSLFSQAYRWLNPGHAYPSHSTAAAPRRHRRFSRQASHAARAAATCKVQLHSPWPSPAPSR